MAADLSGLALAILNVIQLVLLLVVSREAAKVRRDLCDFLSEWSNPEGTDRESADGSQDEPR